VEFCQANAAFADLRVFDRKALPGTSTECGPRLAE
jgi:hypothetical protein